MTRSRLGRWGWGCMAWIAASLAWYAGPAGAVSVSPRVLEAARKDPAASAALRARLERWEASKSSGVDRAYPQFALDLAKYPRGGVAHRNILVVLAQFPAEGGAPAKAPSAASTPFYYHRLFFSDDPNDGILSLREYYKNQSHGRLIVSGAVTSDWLMMPHSYRYYANGASGLDFGSYPRSAQGLTEAAMAAAYTDFDAKLGYFDNDGPDGVSSSGDDDGYIDAVMVIHPGRGAEIIPPGSGEDPNWALWSHEAGITQFSNCDFTNLTSSPDCIPGYTLGNVKGFIYVLGGEYNDYPGDFAVGTYAHEFGHTLGLVDLYDPAAAGLGFFSLMALGNYLPYEQGKVLGSQPGGLDAWSRQYLGFDEPAVATTPGQYTLAAVSEGGGSLKVWSNGEPGTEYFLVEYRKQTGPDVYLPGDGLLIYHVNDLETDNLGGPGNYRVSLIQADSLNPLQLESPTGNFGDPADPFPGTLGKRSITNDTQPNTRSIAGANTGVRIWNIFAGAADGADSATFDLALSTRPELRVASIATSEVSGNGDGYPDPGETVNLTVTLRNVGLASNALTLNLASSDAVATVTTAASSAPAIAGGGTAVTATPFVIDIGTPTDLPYNVPLTLTWSDGSAAGSQMLLLTIGIASGLADGFEPGTQGWTHAPVTNSIDEWHLSISRAHSGTSSMKVGSSNPLGSGSNEAQTYASDEDAALVSPAFDLPANSELVFWSWIDAETNGGTGAWDGGRVEISMNGGEWVPLSVDGGYGYIMEFNSSAALRGSDVVSGSPQRWRRMVADLTPYAGSARIRFRFASDEANDPRLGSSLAQLRYYEGWYIDDVSVQSRTGGGPIARRISFRAGPNPYWLNGPSSGLIHFRFSAPNGLPAPGQTPEIHIYDVRGREVGHTVAVANPLAPAEFLASWNPRSQGGASLGSGIYFARLDFSGNVQTTRLVLVR